MGCISIGTFFTVTVATLARLSGQACFDMSVEHLATTTVLYAQLHLQA